MRVSPVSSISCQPKHLRKVHNAPAPETTPLNSIPSNEVSFKGTVSSIFGVCTGIAGGLMGFVFGGPLGAIVGASITAVSADAVGREAEENGYSSDYDTDSDYYCGQY